MVCSFWFQVFELVLSNGSIFDFYINVLVFIFVLNFISDDDGRNRIVIYYCLRNYSCGVSDVGDFDVFWLRRENQKFKKEFI